MQDAEEPPDVEMVEEQPSVKPKPKGKAAGKSTAVRFEEPPKDEEDKETDLSQKLDRLSDKDEVTEIYKVYWSRKHDQIVAKIQVKRSPPEKKGDLSRNRQYADTTVLTKIPVRELKDRKAVLFIDFMSELIKDEIRRQKEKAKKEERDK